MPSYLITGSSTGIGLAIVEDLLSRPDTFVVATALDPAGSTRFQELAAQYSKDRLAYITLDISDVPSTEAAAKQAAAILPNGLDNLVLNAGVNYQPLCTFDDINFEYLRDELRFNTEYAITTIRAFLPLVRRSKEKRIVFVSSELGSISMAPEVPGLSNAYSIGKAAFNMTARKYGAVLKQEGINTVVVQPGWVKTALGHAIQPWVDAYAPHLQPISPQAAAAGIVKVLDSAQLKDSTTFWSYDGEKKDW